MLELIHSGNDPVLGNKFLTLEKNPLLSRLGDVTMEALIIRLFTVLSAEIGLNCVQGGIYHLPALLTVRQKISESAELPPFYGPPTEAYTLQGFCK
jgi:hypothetical protein